MKLLKLAACFVISYSAAVIGSVATAKYVPTWYADLNKPFFNPPNWLFAPVWTILYACIAVSLFLIWTAETDKNKRSAYVVFAIQMILNTAWSLIFFGLQEIWLAFVVIVLLDIMVLVTIWKFWSIDQRASDLLLPYMFWIMFATSLNLAIGLLN